MGMAMDRRQKPHSSMSSVAIGFVYLCELSASISEPKAPAS